MQSQFEVPDLEKILVCEYESIQGVKRIPKLDLRLNSNRTEGFHASYAGNVLTIEAQSHLEQAYGISKLGVALRANHLHDFLGEHTPRFQLRPLWLKGDQEFTLNSTLKISIPKLLSNPEAKKTLPKVCKRLIECGFNALIIGSYFEKAALPAATLTTSELKGLFDQLHAHGILLILKPDFDLPKTAFCPYEEEFLSSTEKSFDLFFKNFSNLAGIFWESLRQKEGYRSHPRARYATDAEATLKEIQGLEQALRQRTRLIFYLACPPEKKESLLQARWMASLIDQIHPNSMLAFTAVHGHFYDDHAPDHPLWEILRQTPHASSNAWMPLINLGLIKQGEGLWPLTNLDLLDRFMPRCQRHSFGGIIGMASDICLPGSLLDCNLWVAGHSFWHSCSPSLLAETWFKAFKAEDHFTPCLKGLARARELALILSELRTKALPFPPTGEEARIYGELVMSKLKELKAFWEKHPSVFLKSYWPYFARDIKHLLTNYLPTFSLPFSYMVDNQDPLHSFWAHNQENVCRFKEDPIMENIFSSTFLND